MTTYTPHMLGLPRYVWPQRGHGPRDGEGVVIGVIDTGINPTHPSFAYNPKYPSGSNKDVPLYAGTCEICQNFTAGSCNGKIITARYYAAGAAAVIPLNASIDLSPFDALGHGSHVASIAAGNWGVPVVVNGFMYGFASGMAPSARLAVYKAMYPQGGTVTDIISAIDQAAQDRVDVLVLSIGPDEPPADGITFLSVLDITLLFARRAGIFVAQAAGNRGPDPASVSSFSPWAMGVAASTTSRAYTPILVLGNGYRIKGIGLSAPTPGDGLFRFTLVAARDATSTSLASAEECQNPGALKLARVAGSIVICSFSQGFYNGTSAITAILDTATSLGFLGFILVANPLYGDFVAEPLPFHIPGIMVPRVTDAQVIWNYYNNHTIRDTNGIVTTYGASAAIKEGRIATFANTAPAVARTSSRGPDITNNQLNPADVLKPDILAPGDQIWGAWSPVSLLSPILSGQHFALISGTSMAAPHVAGVAALVKQYHPSWTPAMIASALSTTASKHDRLGRPIMSQGPELYRLYQSTPFDYGSGLINPSGALDPGLVFPSEFEDYIKFLCSLSNTTSRDIFLATKVTCVAPSDTPSDLNLPSITISSLRGCQSIRRYVKNVAGKTETYLPAVHVPDGVSVHVNPSWFEIGPDGIQHLEITFNVTEASESFNFGELVLIGSLDHIVRLPLVVRPML
ncbi:subtilisin-like protease SBT3.5 [Carex littledalei]|uniref:Subtilisin-like protease SBT3.5 n=1 Tax=Carex littledalei TaxID=544730 RepID=A0A833QLX2_9POAL|nr:subtilisin-like protease SBT3.5 [Carex littledalei]